MSLRSEALFLNGVFKSVVEEILLVQEHLPYHIMFLQPYSPKRIAILADNPPSVDDRVRLFYPSPMISPMFTMLAKLLAGTTNEIFPGPGRSRSIV
jgi:hypothetical protein